MKFDRTRNATRNILWGTVERITLLILPFATRTVLIKTLGAEYLGLSSLFTSILSVLSISELGIGTAIVYSMYKPIAEDDRDTVCALLNLYRKVYRIIGLVILTAGMAVAPFLPLLIKGDVPADVNLYILYFIYLFNAVISYFLYAYKGALFAAHQRNDVASKRIAVINTLGNLIRIVLLLVYRDYYVFVLVIPLTTMATNLANAWMAEKMFPELDGRGDVPEQMKGDIKKRIVGLLALRVHNVVFYQVDSIVISAFLGLTTLAIFQNYYFIQNTVAGFLIMASHSLTSGIGNKMVTSSVEENYRDFKKIVFVNSWIVGWCAVCLVCLYQPFMKLWVGEKLLFPTQTMVLMVLYFVVARVCAISSTYRDAAGLWWDDRYRPLVTSATNLAVNIALVQFIGIDGVILSTLLVTVFISLPWGNSVLFKQYFKTSSDEHIVKLIQYTGVTLAAGAVTYAACCWLPFDGVAGLLVRAVICLALPNVLFWLAFRKQEEFAAAKSIYTRGIHALKARIRPKRQ